MKRALVCLIAACLLAEPTLAPVASRPRPPRRIGSPPGQVVVVTVNAHQVRVLGLKRLIAMLELTHALRSRPLAFNGGNEGAVAAPDAIIVSEIRPTNVEIFERLLRQNFNVKYLIAGESDTSAVIIYNTATLRLDSVERWADVCTSADMPTDNRTFRDYPIIRFREAQTGAPLTIAGMHLAKSYRSAGGQGCVTRNMEELRGNLAEDTGAVIIGGDFNKRPVAFQYECDPGEDSASAGWWLMLTQPTDGGRAYIDAVRAHHDFHGLPMRYEWTHEWLTRGRDCTGKSGIRRTRIDYLFTGGTVIAEAHADHPGWGAIRPGYRHPENFRYSDHRWVWGRFIVSGPPRPLRPTATVQSGGQITLSWLATPDLNAWVVLRANAGKAYREMVRLPPETTSWTDTRTRHDQPYRYAIVPVAHDGGHGLESPAARATADAHGPRVISVDPPPGSTSVDPGIKIGVSFDERVLPESVSNSSIRVFSGTRRIPGFTNVYSARVIRFNPSVRLPGRRTLRVIVSGVKDRLSNVGPRYSWRFTTRGRA